MHDRIIGDLYAAASNVPCEHKAIVAGGLPGAGKTTVLHERAGIDLSQYLMINPDVIKEHMVRRGLVPKVKGLSPMEATELAHEESSHIAKRLAERAQAAGKNLIWDITMSSDKSTEGRIQLLRQAGYAWIEGIFVDIPVDVSLRRADARHREGHEQYRRGHGLGGRFVHADLVLAQAQPGWGSKNCETFERLKPRFDAWSRYDNSSDGHPAALVERYVANVIHDRRPTGEHESDS